MTDSETPTRRRVLQVTASAAAAGIAGCFGGGEGETTTTEMMEETTTEAMTETTTSGDSMEETTTEEAMMEPATFDVRVENVSSGNTLQVPQETAPVPLSPGVYAVHTGSSPLFTPGEAASAGLESLAEDGKPGTLAEEVSTAGPVTSGTFSTPEGSGSSGPLFPGKSYEFVFEAPPEDDPHLSLATMFVQSNDLFYAPDTEGIPLFDGGDPNEGTVTTSLRLWDAGTETNQPPGVGGEQAPRQMSANSGASENGVVRAIDDVDDGYDYPATGEVVEVTLETLGGGMGNATEFRVTVTNVSTPETLVTSTKGAAVPLSPGAYAVHGPDVSLFQPGEAASPGLESLAEDGKPGGLVSDLGSTDGVAMGGAFTTPSGADDPGPLLPGNAYEFQVEAPPGEDRRLSLATMFVQSNDLFFAPDPEGIALFDGEEPIDGDVTAEFALWDAGTEVDQPPGAGSEQAPRQMEADSGEDENGVVTRVDGSDDGFGYPDVDAVVRVTVSPK